MQTKLSTELKHREPQKLAAIAVLEDHPEGNFILHKTTRAGATTGIIAASVDRGEKIVAIVPTNAIATDTVLLKAKNYIEDPEKWLVRCPPNHECKHNQKLIEECPDIGKLHMLPINHDCMGCEYLGTCQLTEIVRSCGDWDACVLSYHKLYALMMLKESRKYVKKESPEDFSMSEQIIRTLESDTVNILLDECHTLQYGDKKEISIAWKGKKNGNQVDRKGSGKLGRKMRKIKHDEKPEIVKNGMGRYSGLIGSEEFPWLSEVVINIQRLLDYKGTIEATDALFTDLENRTIGSKKMSIQIVNPFDDLGHDEDGGTMMAVVSELVELMKVRTEYNLSAEEVADLQWYFFLSASPKIEIHAVRDGENIAIKAVAVNHEFNRMIGQFIAEAQRNRKHKRTFFTSATVGSYDYRQLLPRGAKLKDVFFGRHGDPCDTVSKQFILSDRWKLQAYGRNGLKARMPDIVDGIKAISAHLGREEGIVVVGMSVRHKEMLQKQIRDVPELYNVAVTYYRAPDTLGVEGKARVMILVGMAEKPINSYDAITSTKEESMQMYEESMHIDTYQTLSRCKDPKGERNSYVFGIGCRYEDLLNAVTWGTGRKLAHVGGDRRQYFVKVAKTLPIPKLIQCNGVGEMLANVDIDVISVNMRELSDIPAELRMSIEAVPKTRPVETVPHSDIVKEFNQPLKMPYVYNIRQFSSSCKKVRNVRQSQSVCSDVTTSSHSGGIESVSTVFFTETNINKGVKNETRIENDVLKDSIREMRKNRVTVHSKIDFLRHFIIRPDVLYEQTDDGRWVKKDEPISDEVLQAHIEGKRTIGAVTVGPQGNIHNAVQAICIDIDAHPDKSLVKELRQKKHTNAYAALDEYNALKTEYGDLPELNREFFAKVDQYHNDFRAAVREHIREQIGNARARVDRLCETMHDLALHPLVEASGGPGSFHVWHFVKYVDAGTAREFGKFLCHLAGLPSNTEVFPKQAGVSKGGYGNQVKLPLAFHRKHSTWSKILIGNEFVRDFDEMELHAVDITGFRWAPQSQSHGLEPVQSFVDANGEEYENVRIVSYHGTSKRRREFFDWLIEQDLTGEQGHSARIAITREFSARGMSPNDIAQLFAWQGDFNHAITMQHVASILAKDYGPWKWDTLRDRCGSYVNAWERMQDAQYASVTSPLKSIG